MNYKIERVLTDNPYVDELVYQVKILALGCILKNEQEALNNETEYTLKQSGIYLSCLNNTASYSILEYPEEMFNLLPSISQPIKDSIMKDKENLVNEKVVYSDTNGVAVNNRLTDEQRDLIINTAIKYTIDNYVEYNNYYRRIAGLPDIGDDGIKIKDVEGIIIQDGVFSDDTINNKYIHEYSNTEMILLEDLGILDEIKSRFPDKKYLDHLYPKSIDFYTARKAFAFQVLYIPEIDQQTIYERFKEKLDINRDYTVKTIYSEAYKFNSDYYDSIIMVLIVIQTIIDMISEVQEIIANKELLDIRSIKYILESYGVPFFNEIPLKYQISIIKNINTLLKFKSTSKNIKDILSIFGFDDIMVYKYYLLKDRKIDNNGNYIFNSDDDYDLSFIKVPISENNPDVYLKNKENKMNYTEIISNDETWNGGLEESIVKNDILKENFNYISTKYISIDTMYNMTELTFQVPYFFNALFDNKKIGELMTLNIPLLSETHMFKLTDVFVYLFVMSHRYYGVEDNIMTDSVAISHVLGFNFDADMTKLKEYITASDYDYETLMQGNEFVIPTTLLGYEQFFDMMSKNEATLSFIKTKLKTSTDKNEYDVYKKIYDTCMIKKFNTDYYKVLGSDGNHYLPTTYTDYLATRDSILYSSITEVDDLAFDDTKQKELIISNVDKITTELFEYISSDEYKYIYEQFPGGSALTLMSNYIYKIINFFKSYKIDFLGANSAYEFNDRFDTGIFYIDWLGISINFIKNDILLYRDGMELKSNLKYNDKINIRDYLYIQSTYN